MSYRAGVSPALAALIGRVGTTNPHIVCDRCGRARGVWRNARSYAPAKWLMDGRPAPGWHGGRREDGTRADVCGACVAELLEPWLGQKPAGETRGFPARGI